MRVRALVAVACLGMAACSGGSAEPAFDAAAVTTTAAAVTSTTATTVPAPAPPAPPPAAPLAGVQAPVVLSPRGVVLPVAGPEGAGLRVHTPCGRTAVVTQGTAVPSAQVVLDPGHGGSEPGAIGPNRLTEKAANSAIAEEAREALAAEGVSAVLTRTADYRMTLGARARVATALKPQAFLSVHNNADPDGLHDGPGTETYYQIRSPQSKRLAGLVYEEVVATLRPFQLSWVGDTDAGAKYRPNSRGGDYYGVLRQTAGVTGVLAEYMFISNGPEADLLARPDVQAALGQATARAIVRFLRTDDPGSGYVEPYPRETPAGPGGGSAGCVDPPL